MRIDAHHHIWRLARADYGWLTPELAPIYRDVSLAEFAPLAARRGIGRTILVQAAPTSAETAFLLSAARSSDLVAGVVGWTDLSSPDARSAIASLARDPLIVGLRPMVQDIPDDDWLVRPDLAPAFAALEDHGLAFDALVLPQHLPRLLAVADRHPGLRIVVDHGAKPPIRERRLDPWRHDMTALAARKNVVCKLSGLVTEAGPDWRVTDLKPYTDHLLAAFGPDRLLWGSDWPVVDLAGGFERWCAATDGLLAGLAAAEAEAILGGNAARIYLARAGRSLAG